MLGKGEIRRAGWPREAVRWILLALAAVLIVGVLQLLPDGKASGEASDGTPPAKLEPVEGSDLKRVHLTEQAAERLDLQTAEVSGAGAGGGATTAIPYSAVIYDAEGNTWVYMEAEPLVFLRAPIEVERIGGARALLAQGPPPGTTVVRVGAAELYGTELEVDH